jgi:hypothetical protein
MKCIQRNWDGGTAIESLPIKALHTVSVQAKHGAVSLTHTGTQRRYKDGAD